MAICFDKLGRSKAATEGLPITIPSTQDILTILRAWLRLFTLAISSKAAVTVSKPDVPFSSSGVATFTFDASRTNSSVLEQLDLLESLCSFEVDNSRAIRNIFFESPELVRFALETVSAIQQYWPKATRTIELVEDPADYGDQLVMQIHTCDQPSEAMKKLDDFDNAWWLDNADRVEGALLVNLRYC